MSEKTLFESGADSLGVRTVLSFVHCPARIEATSNFADAYVFPFVKEDKRICTDPCNLFTVSGFIQKEAL